MKKILILGIALATMVSCSNKKSNEAEKITKEAEKIEKAIDDLPQATTTAKKIFNAKSGYVKYKSQAAGMEMIREFWFDDFGALQYEENYMMMMGSKTGGSALIRDGERYTWDYSATEGMKSKFYAAVYSEFEKVSKDDVDRYKIKDLGYENIAGKKCRKISVEKPIEAITWTWEGVPMKTITKLAGNDVTMEAVEVNEETIPASKFELPAGVTFKEM